MKSQVILFSLIILMTSSCGFVYISGLFVIDIFNYSPNDEYEFENYSKANIYSAIKDMRKDMPELFVKKDTLGDFFKKHYGLSEYSVDSICFHFKLKYQDTINIIYWVQVLGLNREWNLVKHTDYPTTFAIVGVSYNYHGWIGNSSAKNSMKERKLRRKLVKEFEIKILPIFKEYLIRTH